MKIQSLRNFSVKDTENKRTWAKAFNKNKVPDHCLFIFALDFLESPFPSFNTQVNADLFLKKIKKSFIIILNLVDDGPF